jgi:hypothetical protein
MKKDLVCQLNISTQYGVSAIITRRNVECNFLRPLMCGFQEGRSVVYVSTKESKGVLLTACPKAPKAGGHPVQPWVQRRATPSDSIDLVNRSPYWHFGRFSL